MRSLAFATYETFNAKLQAASNNITDQIKNTGRKNPDLSVAVRIEQSAPWRSPAAKHRHRRVGAHPQRAAPSRHAILRAQRRFSSSSSSFLVKFAQVKDDESPVVLLLDEPGLTLHGKAQGDLLRFFNEEAGTAPPDHLLDTLTIHGASG
jgi:hypothetical protein